MTVRMYKVIENEVGVPIKAWTKGVLLEQAAENKFGMWLLCHSFINGWLSCLMCIGASARPWGV